MATINFDYKKLRNTLDSYGLNQRAVFDGVGSQLFDSFLKPGQALREIDKQIMRAGNKGDTESVGILQEQYNKQLQDSYTNFQKALSANLPNTKQLTDFVSPQFKGLDKAYENVRNMTLQDYEGAMLKGTTGGDLLMRNMDVFEGVSNSAGITRGLQPSPFQQAGNLNLEAIQALNDPLARGQEVVNQVTNMFTNMGQDAFNLDPRFDQGSGFVTISNIANTLQGLGAPQLGQQFAQNPGQVAANFRQNGQETLSQYQARLANQLLGGK